MTESFPPSEFASSRRICFVEPEREYTELDVSQRSLALSTVLTRHSITRAAVLSTDPFHLVRALWACNLTGADLYIVNPEVPSAYVDQLISMRSIQLKIGESDELVVSAHPQQSTAGVFLMTSGTTGAPKIVEHSMASLLPRKHPSSPSASSSVDRWLLTYQATGFAGLQVILTAVLTGAALVVPSKRTPIGFHEAAVRHQPTHISGTTTFWRTFLLQLRPGELKRVRQATLGGEPVDQAILDALARALPKARISHTYASTETGVVYAVHDGRAGFPKSWLDDNSRNVGIRIRDGHLEVLSPRRMRGYSATLSATPVPFTWITTHDQCEIRGDRVVIVGRQDAVISVAGTKVDPFVVLEAILKAEQVVDARVYGVSSPICGNLVAADVVLLEGEDEDQARAAILERCTAFLTPPQIPRIINFLSAIEARPSGKRT